jgi:hypothetical protein
MGIEIEGLNEVLAKLDQTAKGFEEATRAAVYGQALALDELANRSGMVPLQTGALRASHYVTLPDSGVQPVSEMGYAAPYAGSVHEREENVHSRGHGTVKWLEKALSIFSNALAVRLKESILAYLADGTTCSSLSGIAPTTPEYAATAKAAKRGFTRAQAKRVRELKKSGALHLVRRWGRKG